MSQHQLKMVFTSHLVSNKFLVSLPWTMKVVIGSNVSEFGILDIVFTSFWSRCRGLFNQSLVM